MQCFVLPFGMRKPFSGRSGYGVYTPVERILSVQQRKLCTGQFWFTVTDEGEASLVTGECRDEDGDLYLEEEGIPIKAETLWQLRRLNLEQLETYVPPELPDDLELPEILDAGSVALMLTLPDGQTVEKCITHEMAITIYEILLPCLAK